jgi:hypothetical protein
MAGVPGRSGGHNRKSPEAHLVAGTWRVSRHGPKPATVGALAQSQPAKVEPLADVLEGLGPEGARLVRAVFADYQVSAVEAMVLRVAALSLDDASTLRTSNDTKGARAAHRQFLQAMGRLGLPMWDRK